ncbi:MAG: Gfo/Idh/MocA family oxidoreductase [Clostridiales bacterium]|jgi:predicted dehydrogenase|nr:Gfo/Idh/MocA family oxidoreductase [Clostridiales bacterium]
MIKTGLIGCGKVGDFHAHAFASLCDSSFAGVFDADYSRAELFAAKYNVKAFKTIDEFILSGIQGASICVPHPLHAATAVPLLEAGVNVLIEKPLASNLEDCDRILKASKKGNAAVGVVCQRRFYRPCVRLKKAIDDGKIGVPIIGQVNMMGWRDKTYYDSDPWRGTWKDEGGGVMVNQAPHQLDLLLWYMGDIDQLYGVAVNLNHPYIEVEDTAAAVIRFRNGGIGNILVSNSQNPGLYGKVHIFGSNGASVGVQTDGGAMFIAGISDITEPPINDIWTIPGEENKLWDWKIEDSHFFNSVDTNYFYHERQIENFLRSLLGTEKLLITGEDGKKTVELFTAVYRASVSGGTVKFPLR